MRLHIDTDFGDNPDDACALVMLLGWEGVELTAVTTSADADGARAEGVRALLRRLGAGEVPVVAGGADAVGRLEDSVRSGAAVAAIGPCTNLAPLTGARSGALADATVVTMGGWVDLPGPGYPAWGPERDSNVQADPEAAMAVYGSSADLTLVPCASAVPACVRTGHLPRLAASGPVGALLARQLVAHGQRHRYAQLGRQHAALPEDLVTFLWDPVACAVAVGWAGATVTEERLRPVREGRVVRFQRDADGRRTRVLAPVDGEAFVTTWLRAVEAAQAGAA
jgi:pyrimidine-specific ribonucleoside hydrolase